MTQTIDQSAVQQRSLWPSEQSNTPGLVDSLARASATGGQWVSSSITYNGPSGQNRRSRSNEPTPLATYLHQAHALRAELVKREQGAAEEKEYQQALQWLAANRQRYAGQWIALRGSQLLATGRTASDVYTRVRGQRPPALVVQVESQELPFAGW